MKKVYGYLGLLVLVVLLSSSFVAAATGFEILFGGVSDFNFQKWLADNFREDALTLIMMGLLLWIILYSVMKKSMGGMFNNSGILTGTVSLIVTIIVFLYIQKTPFLIEFAEGTIGAIGLTILTVFPFIIAIYFTIWVSPSLWAARAVWLTFMLYFVYTLFFVTEWGNNVSIWWFIVALIASAALFAGMPLIRKSFWNFTIHSDEEKAERKLDQAEKGVELWKKAFDKLVK